ncbi:MAG: ATP-binding protein [Pseudomonadota bacterium]
MDERAPTLPTDGETIAELRELYRAAEARAARLRLLSASGKDLAEAGADNLEASLQRCAERLAFFVGSRSGSVEAADCKAGIGVYAPGKDTNTVRKLIIEGLDSLEAIPDDEDREAFRIHLGMMGATIDRINTERDRSALLTRLQDREKTLQILLEKVFTAQEEERRRVSHELHDGVAQTATALLRLLEGAQAGQVTSAAELSPTSVARSLVSELRRVIAGLRPTLLDDLGFFAALQSLLEGLESEGFAVTMHVSGDDKMLSSLFETALFRVAQEAITNIHKHAGGPCAVTIEVDLDADPMVLRIADTGCGPSEATIAAKGVAGHNVGIEVMNERMSTIGGVLDWRQGQDGGVTVEAVLPRKVML